MIKRRAQLLASLVLSLLWAESLSAQCSLCKMALLNSPEGARMAQAFNQGILLLLGAPFLVFGAVALLVFRAHRRDKRREA